MKWNLCLPNDNPLTCIYVLFNYKRTKNIVAFVYICSLKILNLYLYHKMTDYLDELNESQRAAVLYNDGPSLVIAGAGSGKTRVLTYKVKYLIQEKGYDARSILALTFTNKAAKEIVTRVNSEIGLPWSDYIWMGTFHSVFLRILRQHANIIGFTPNFTIYDSGDSKNFIKSLVKELNLDERTYKPGLILSRISNAKNRLVSPQAYAASGELYRLDVEAKIPAMRDIYIRYCERCKQGNVMDFDDIIVYIYQLLNNHPEIREKYATKFKYVFVDEYQDTNEAQSRILSLLVKEPWRICVVGDDAQSIYSFRGATIDNILNFTKSYPGARLFKLEQNYRSTQLIVKAANSLIEKNREQIKKEVFSENQVGEPISVTSAYSDVEEGEIVANKITSMHVKDGCSYSDFAILYRTNAQSRIFEEALRKRAVPYRIYGGLSFYQRKEIKDVIAYFRLAVNPHDGEALKRVINYPARGIGDTTLNKINMAASDAGVSLWTVISSPLDYGLNINKGTHTKLQAFRDMVSGFISKADSVSAYEIGKEIVSASGIMADIIQDTSPEGMSRRENIDELVNGMYDFCEIHREEGNDRMFLTDYLSEVALLTDQDGEKDDSVPKVTLMTIHSAKGLEFRNVFIVGMEENLFPGPMSSDSPRALEEERRLFYVAITRAEENCFISYAKNRYKYGKQEFCNPSRFLKDINPSFLKLPKDAIGGMPRRTDEYAPRNYERGYGRSETYRSSGPSMFDGGEMPQEPVRFVKPVPTRNLKRIVPVARPSSVSSGSNIPQGGAATHGVSVGRMIEHERFGIGEVVRLEGTGDNCKATVRFENAGEKQLLLKFARFKIIG